MKHLPTMLVALDDIAYLVECAAMDHTGELKSELSRLCDQIRSGSLEHAAPIVLAALPVLDECLALYRVGDKAGATSRLVGIARSWWRAARSEAAA